MIDEPITVVDFECQQLRRHSQIQRAFEAQRIAAHEARLRRRAWRHTAALAIAAASCVWFGACIAVAAG